MANRKRNKGELYEDYKKSLKEENNLTYKFIESGDTNRDYNRGNLSYDPGRITSFSRLQNKVFRHKFRGTKQLKLIRGKYMYGDYDVTYAVKNNISPVSYIQHQLLKQAKYELENKNNLQEKK